jgi:hypothetical protein
MSAQSLIAGPLYLLVANSSNVLHAKADRKTLQMCIVLTNVHRACKKATEAAESVSREKKRVRDDVPHEEEHPPQ